MRYTFVHISDLHYQPGRTEDVELVCREFGKDLAGLIGRLNNPYLLFSGDLVLAGAETAYYTALLKHLDPQLDAVGLSRDRRFSVPGNHDVSQIALKPVLTIETGALSQISEESHFNDEVPRLSEVVFSAKFANYAQAEITFAAHGCCANRLGGEGWILPGGLGVYCLNTALCSSAGLKDTKGQTVKDKERLMIDTRTLQEWLATTAATARVLVMHHPLDWLADWAKTELERIISKDFQLVFSGHVHESSTTYAKQTFGPSVHFVAPPLFTHKRDPLGYGIVELDTDSKTVAIQYRSWTKFHTFVNGASLAGTDSGTLAFSLGPSATVPLVFPTVTSPVTTRAVLQAEFDEASTCYSSKKRLWVDRDLSALPETDMDGQTAVLSTTQDLVRNFRSCTVRAPKQYGLTCLGRFIALEHHRRTADATVIAMINAVDVPPHKQGVMSHIVTRCEELGTSPNALRGIILDNYVPEKRSRRVIRELRSAFPQLPILILHNVDDVVHIAELIEDEDSEPVETLFLWALTQSRIRDLVRLYLEGHDTLDETLVTKKVTTDIDALNMHRTPLNCLLILKLTEQAFDDSPVNRTEMIGRVLTLLFYQFDSIPRYATRPDLKDCEYALGYFCEWLVRRGNSAFTKADFYEKVQEYCRLKLIDLDVEVLFAFLATENIFIRKGLDFEFRFTYWLYFFAAHRMHHDPGFSDFILSNNRYTANPEIIEFYAGIDRRRSDAVARLTSDLSALNADFLARTNIAPDLNPYKQATWAPTREGLRLLEEEVVSSVEGSSLPSEIKDAIADSHYDRAKPYNQALAQFIHDSSIKQMIQAMRAAARVLRNSDHVSPNAKADLLDQVITCWVRVCQLLVLLSPVLAARRSATFEDMSFILDRSFDDVDEADRWNTVVTVIVDNIVKWYQEDLFSKRMGALLGGYVKDHEGELSELLVLMMMIRQKPPNWEKHIQRVIVREKKNSFVLGKLFSILRNERQVSFSTERTKQELRRLAAMALAKHSTGAKHPNLKLTAQAADALDEKDDSD